MATVRLGVVTFLFLVFFLSEAWGGSAVFSFGVFEGGLTAAGAGSFSQLAGPTAGYLTYEGSQRERSRVRSTGKQPRYRSGSRYYHKVYGGYVKRNSVRRMKGVTAR